MTNLLLSLHWKQSDEHFFLYLQILVTLFCVNRKSINFVHHIFSIYGMLLVFDTSELWLCLVCWAFTWIELLLLLLMDDVDTINHLWLVILFHLPSFTSNEKNHIFFRGWQVSVRGSNRIFSNIYGFGHPKRLH